MNSYEHLNGIATFVEVVECGGFAAAARKLHLTRSAVSKRVSELETRLGLRLLNRTTRSQSLTSAGQGFYDKCRRALTELDEASQLMDIARNEPAGLLRVTVPSVLGRECIAPALAGLLDDHPHLDLEISFSDRVVDLAGEAFDLAVRIGPLPNSGSLAARRLGSQHFVLCAAPEYLNCHGRPTVYEDFRGHTAVVYDAPGPAGAWNVADEAGEIRALPVRRRVGFDDLQAIRDAAIAGTGLARLPNWLIERHLSRGELVALSPPGERMLKADVHLVWIAARTLPPRIRVGIDVLLKKVAPRLAAANG